MIRHRLEYAALRGVVAVIERLPLGLALWTIRRLGGLFFLLDRRRKPVAIANLLRTGIAADRAQAKKLARASYHHGAQLIVEALRPGAEVELVASEATRKLFTDPGQPVLLSSGHVGNWEIAAQYLSTMKPMAGITRVMNNPLVESWVQQRKPRDRFRMIPKTDADTARFLRVLEAGEVLALLVDQHGGHRGVRVPFFGHDASTHASVAMLHLVSGAPLVFCACLRTGPMQFKLTITDPCDVPRTGKRKDDVRAILGWFNAQLEAAIREAPEQYVWSHRRWRNLEAG